MARFVTPIAVDLQPVLDALPKGALVAGARLTPDGRTVEVEWSHHEFHTGYSAPKPFPLKSLHAGTLPEGVRDGRTPTVDTPNPILQSEEADGEKAESRKQKKKREVAA